MNPFTDLEITQYRQLFPVHHHWIYLNHAGVAPISTLVAQAIQGVVQQAVDWGYIYGTEWMEKTEKIRAQAARWIGAQSEEVAFVKNTSHGISLIAQGLDLRPGDEIILSDAEFPSNVYPWMALEKKGVLLKKITEQGGELQIDQIAKLTTKKTKLVALSSVQYASGYRLPIQEVGSFCRKHNILFFVDAIQSLGAFPFHVKKENIDFMTADAHKWILGPEGIGILYVRKKLIEQIDPVLIGWHTVTDPFNFDQYHFTYSPTSTRFEEGSPSTFLIYGLGAAIDLLLEAGIDRIEKRLIYLNDYLIEGLKELKIKITNSMNLKYRSGIVAFQLPEDKTGKKLLELESHLFAKKICVTTRRNSLRVSPHFYNTKEELDILLQEIKLFL
jgi:selenocysteine lyase/cysteine desulfurase